MPTIKQELDDLKKRLTDQEVRLVSLRNALISWREKSVAWQDAIIDRMSAEAQEDEVKKRKERRRNANT